MYIAVILEECAASTWRMADSEFMITPLSESMLRICSKAHTGHVSVIAVFNCLCIHQPMQLEMGRGQGGSTGPCGPCE